MVDFQSRKTRRDDRDTETDDEEGEPENDESQHDDQDSHDKHEHDHKHDHHHHDVEHVGAAVVTVSSTRSITDDPAGDAIATAFKEDGNEVVVRELVADDFNQIQDTVNHLVSRRDVDVVVSTGGTGVTPDDVTVEAASALFEKDLPGFGELFRLLSHDEIGTKVVGTRATGGIVGGTPVFCLPGSENAARLGSEEIIVPEANHLVGLARRDTGDN